MVSQHPLELTEPGRSEYQAEFLQKNPGVGATVRELLDLQRRYFALDRQFRDEMWQLEQQHYERCQSLFRKRAAIASGSGDEPGTRLYSEVAGGSGSGSKVPASAARGLPHLWLRAMKNCPNVAKYIRTRDGAALSYLSNVHVEFLKGGVIGFKLLFHFDENPFFENRVLTKELIYEMESEDDGIYGELMNSKATGCEIHWKPGMDLTDMAEVAPGKVEFESFFDFFASTSWEEEGEDGDEDGDEHDRHHEAEDEEDQEEDDNWNFALDADFELGEYFKDSLIPYAIHWYTGEALLFEDEEEEEEEEDAHVSDQRQAYGAGYGGPNFGYPGSGVPYRSR